MLRFCGVAYCIFGLLAATLSGCAGVGRSNGLAASHAKILTIAIAGEPATLDPLVSDSAFELYVEEVIFDGLVKFGANGRLLPDLAAQVPSRANGGISADLRTITYRLRHDVVWQDGVPFTATDVVFTYRSLISGRLASPLRSLYEEIASVNAPNPYTVTVRLRKPSVAAIRQLFVAGAGSIVPKHILENVADIRRSSFAIRPVGTGPFAVRDWKKGDYIDLVANRRYFAGAPRIAKLRVAVVPAASTRVALLTTGDLDVAMVNSDEAASLRSVPSVRVFESRSSNIFYLELNTRRAPLNERAVREALAYAVDRGELAKPFAGMGRPAFSLMPPGPFDPSAQPAACVGKRTANAAALLTRAGWLSAGKHIRERHGQRLSIDLVYDPGPVMGGIALQLQQAWQGLGVETRLRALPLGVLYDSHGLVTTGRYDAAVDEVAITDPSDLLQIVGSSSMPPAGFNYPRYRNTKVDAWLQSANATDDAHARAQLYAQVDRALCRDVPFVPLLWKKYLIAVNRRVQGFAPEPMTSDLWNVASWSLK
ncbi:MAG TPA: ABC transporter substrate-binding protein [Candidatus Baltobacteraceae bacterium]|nr:ABC transporter substrate-binding protein [Candidatus Baltobacteraceae bacterium]